MLLGGKFAYKGFGKYLFNGPITYGTVRGWVNKFNTIEAIGNAATAVSTIVETVEGGVQAAATGGLGAEGITAQAQLLNAQTRGLVAAREGKS